MTSTSELSTMEYHHRGDSALQCRSTLNPVVDRILHNVVAGFGSTASMLLQCGA
jgi:hypothetical protein